VAAVGSGGVASWGGDGSAGVRLSSGGWVSMCIATVCLCVLLDLANQMMKIPEHDKTTETTL